MAYHQREHLDPNHLLTETVYSDKFTYRCDICLLDLAGLASYSCGICGIHIHKGCADHFQKFINFFADHEHPLKLIRTPGGARIRHECNLCKEDCPPARFVYRCVECDFDLHPLCSLLPETAESPFHPGHRLRMVTSLPACCSVCHYRLPLWHYVCSCSVNFKLHIACALDMEGLTGAVGHCGSGGTNIQGSFGAVDKRGSGYAGLGSNSNFVIRPPAAMIQGNNNNPLYHAGYIPHINMIPRPEYTNASISGLHGPVPAIIPVFGHPVAGISGPPVLGQGYAGHAIPVGHIPAATGSSSQQNPVAKPNRASAIAKFLLKQSFCIALNVATAGLSAPLVDILSAALSG